MSKVGDGGGLRYNNDKIPLEFVPPSLMFAVASVLKKGAEKYEPRNWERGMSWSTVSGCLLRHVFKWLSPLHSDIDEETGLNHLWHAACNVAMLIEYQNTCKNLDDRVKYNLENQMEDKSEMFAKEKAEAATRLEKRMAFDTEMEDLYKEHLNQRKGKKEKYFTKKGTDNI